MFDAEGNLLDAQIDNLGPIDLINDDEYWPLYEQRLLDLGDVSFERIEVAPFSIERFGTTFGLVLRVTEDDDEVWAVEVLPGNYMAFFEPWDDGEYYT